MLDSLISLAIIFIGIALLILGAIYFKFAKVKKKVHKFLEKFNCCG